MKDLTASGYVHPSTQQCTIPLASAENAGLMSAEDKVKLDELIEKNKYDGLIVGEIALGNKIDMGDYTWLVCHKTANYFNLILNTISEECQFDEYELHSEYANSAIAEKCMAFLSSLSGPVQNLLQSVSVEGVTNKIFIPTYSQMNGGFSWFNNNSRRICYNTTGSAVSYWTSTESNEPRRYVYYVGGNGGFQESNVERILGFRPACRIKLQ